MTWKEFKDKVESAGVKDGDEIHYIDTYGNDDMVINPPEKVRKDRGDSWWHEGFQVYD